MAKKENIVETAKEIKDIIVDAVTDQETVEAAKIIKDATKEALGKVVDTI